MHENKCPQVKFIFGNMDIHTSQYKEIEMVKIQYKKKTCLLSITKETQINRYNSKKAKIIIESLVYKAKH